MERNSNRGGNPIPTQSEAAREAEATHRVLHGGPPPLHGGEAEPEAAVLAIGGELVRLGRAKVYPHLLLPPGRLGQQPCTAAKSHGPFVSVRTNPAPISTATPREIDPRTPSEPNRTAPDCHRAWETSRRGVAAIGGGGGSDLRG